MENMENSGVLDTDECSKAKETLADAKKILIQAEKLEEDAMDDDDDDEEEEH